MEITAQFRPCPSVTSPANPLTSVSPNVSALSGQEFRMSGCSQTLCIFCISVLQKHFTSITKRLVVARRFLKHIIDGDKCHQCLLASADVSWVTFSPLHEGISKNQTRRTCRTEAVGRG